MPQIQASRFCPVCNATKLVAREKVDYTAHALLSLLTLGLWGIIWVALATGQVKWICQTCGTLIKDKQGIFAGFWFILYTAFIAVVYYYWFFANR